MKLLIITQKVDRQDPILGFFHSWIQEFAQHCEQVTVIGQSVGEYQFSVNVTVHSLGKEKGATRFQQILRFWSLQRKLRKDYDTVLVHMTPVWVVLGFLHWKLLRKPVFLWYEARGGGWALPLSLLFVRKVFGATKYGLPHSSRKHVVLGHGIHSEEFPLGVWSRDHQQIITVGRITRTKRMDIILRTFAALPAECRLLIAGGQITTADAEESQRLQQLIQELQLNDRVEIRWVPRTEIPELLGRAGLFLHACQGGLDKVVLEAMCCGCPIVSCSTAAQDILPKQCAATEEEMIPKAQMMLVLNPTEKQELGNKLRDSVILNHSLSKLIQNIYAAMRTSL